jgi:putative DNA methylase
MQIKEPYLQLSLRLDESTLEHNLIDTQFDVYLANQLAKKESYNKHLYRPNTYLHKWWARRCGTTFRYILKHLVGNRSKQNFYTPGGLEGQIILDPMMGGGTTLHEAIRLGANVVGVDIDPIPVLQARATLTEIPLKALEREFSILYDTLYSELAHYYRATCPACDRSFELRFVLYGIRRKCQCQEVVLVDSYVLRHNNDGSVVRICPDTYNILQNDDIVSENTFNHRLPLLEKDQDVCTCGEKFYDDISVPYYQRYIPIAVVGECVEHGLFFAAPQQPDLDLIDYANNKREDLEFSAADFGIIPGPKSLDLLKRGIRSYLDLFSSRQLLYLHHAINALRKVEPPARLKLAMLVSTSTEFNSMLCGYKGASQKRPGAIRHTFAHHAYSFPYTALENNPLHRSRSSGTLQNLFHSRLVRGHKWAMRPIERHINDTRTTKIPIVGEVDAGTEYFDIAELREGSHRFMLIQGTSASLDIPDNSVDHIVTDPPYFDSVQYSDLAAFFRVWLRQLLPTEVRWEYSPNDSAVDQQANGNGQYETVLSDIFSECHRALKKKNGRLIFTFHHWNPKGWAGITIALKNAGFKLVNRYVIHAENPTSVHIVNQNALVHDVVLVLGSAQTSSVPEWTQPGAIDKNDSYLFCEQCGTLLGYLLNNNLTDQAIRDLWSELLAA